MLKIRMTMKKITLFLAVLLLGTAAAAQSRDSVQLRGGSASVDWMQPFSGVSISGPMRVTFVRAGEDGAMRVSYDARSNAASRVKVSVDRDGVLNLREKSSREAADTTEVTICYRVLESLSVDGAEVRFEQPVTEPMIDVRFSGGARADLAFDVRDLVMNVTGKCRLALSGSARYFDLTVSTARVDAGRLTTMSARVDASHGAAVEVCAEERLEAYAASSRIRYVGQPEILRGETALFGGEIVSSDEAVEADNRK